jgi:hypothetical protein
MSNAAPGDYNPLELEVVILGFSFGKRLAIFAWECTPKGTSNFPLQVSLAHLLVTPPSHLKPQKVKKVLSGSFLLTRIAYRPNGSGTANSVKRIFRNIFATHDQK